MGSKLSNNLVLASSSVYRRELLGRLGLSFSHCAPDIDETPGPNEDARDLVSRLALAKARAVAPRFPAHLVIASDQAASCEGAVLGKPGNRAAAIAQLQLSRGRTVQFHTSVCVLNTATSVALTEVGRCLVVFRDLSNEAIERYVDLENPFDCAGSFKSEGLGIALFESIDTKDPTALIGLPLINVVSLLKRFGVDPLTTREDQSSTQRPTAG